MVLMQCPGTMNDPGSLLWPLRGVSRADYQSQYWYT